MQPPKVEPLHFKTYIAVIENSVGSTMFRNFYAVINGEKKDVMEDGNLSCAFFVSSVLTIFDFIERIHATVFGTVKDLEKSGWQKIKEPKTGAVLVWEEKINTKGESHKHIGFYIGENMAISNDSKTGQPKKHHFTFEETEESRIVEAIYWLPDMDTK